MRNPKRIPKVLKEIEKVWKKYPDLRLGQLILNSCGEPPLYCIEDEDLINLLKETDKRLGDI